MKTLTTALNILGFTALFIAYTEGVPLERPAGVRRALQTYGGQSQTTVFPALMQIQKPDAAMPAEA